jgi:hypothetical protein
MLKVTGGFLPLHRIKFIDDECRVECLDGATYQAEPADLAAIMPKMAKNRSSPNDSRGSFVASSMCGRR